MKTLAPRPAGMEKAKSWPAAFTAPNAAVGNQAVLRRLQAKLTVGTVDDPLEHEADRAAEQVMRMPDTTAAPVQISRKCAACEEEESKLQTKREGDAIGGQEAPGAVHQVLSAPGHKLDPQTRAFFEPRFSADFSAIRVHHDAQAADSARQVGARAYAVGDQIVFGAGNFAPHSREGQTLLAHELAHTMQQGGGQQGGALRRDKAPAPDPETQPQQLDQGKTADTATCLVHFVKASTEFTNAHEFASCMASIKSFLAADGSRTVELSGFASEEGSDDFNKELAQRRADTVKGLLVAGGVDGAKLTATGHGADKTYATLEDNRRVEILRPAPPKPIQVPEQPVTGIPFPPASAKAATDLVDYVALMACAETRMGLGTRDMLTVFRQIYYGKPWSAEKNAHWDEVVPCSANIGDPTARLGDPLFQSLQKSQEIAGVDVGHVFVGLEAMMCPSPSVNIHVPVASALGLTTVNMSNEDFATWGGDLGAAVAARAACERLGPDAASKGDCGNVAGPRDLNFYLRMSAPDQDLQGDLAPFAIRAQAAGVACGGSAQRTATLPARRMSEIFDDYYNDANSVLGKAHTNAVRCFLEAIGAQIDPAGKKITNRDTLVGQLQVPVASFALAFYVKIRKMNPDTGEAGLMKIVYARDAVNWFLDWLERRLP